MGLIPLVRDCPGITMLPCLGIAFSVSQANIQVATHSSDQYLIYKQFSTAYLQLPYEASGPNL